MTAKITAATTPKAFYDCSSSERSQSNRVITRCNTRDSISTSTDISTDISISASISASISTSTDTNNTATTNNERTSLLSNQNNYNKNNGSSYIQSNSLPTSTTRTDKYHSDSIHCNVTLPSSVVATITTMIEEQVHQHQHQQELQLQEQELVMSDTNPNTSSTIPTNPHTMTYATINTKKLKLLPLAILVFYNVSGGPFGIEPSIRSAGNLYTIIGFIITPIIWSIPEAYVTAELGSTFCHDSSGGVAWVDVAFGEKWGLVCGYLSWISGATDNAIYPMLFFQYIVSVFFQTQTQTNDNDNDNDVAADVGENEFFDLYDNNIARFAFVSIVSILLAILNYKGLEIVGNASVVICIVSMCPFVIMTIMGIPQIEPSRWLQLPDLNMTNYYYDDNNNNIFNSSNGGNDYYYTQNNNDETLSSLSSSSSSSSSSWFKDIINSSRGVLWAPFLNNMFWNFNSFDAASNFASEVQSVSTTYPRGIFLGLIITISFYIIPLLVVTGSTAYTQGEWIDGQLGQAVIDIGGYWLGGWVVFAAGISNLALFEAELSADSYQLMGMAERGHLPKIFASRSQTYGTPTYSIAVGLLVIICMSVADFTSLVELLNFNYALALLMEYAAFAKLRLTRKDLERPYRIPIPDWAAIPFIIPPCLGILFLFALASWMTYIFLACVFVIGIAFYYLQQMAKVKGWCDFIDVNTNSTNYGYSYDPSFQEEPIIIYDNDNDDNDDELIPSRGFEEEKGENFFVQELI